jgi:hypothetical protein
LALSLVIFESGSNFDGHRVRISATLLLDLPLWYKLNHKQSQGEKKFDLVMSKMSEDLILIDLHRKLDLTPDLSPSLMIG